MSRNTAALHPPFTHSQTSHTGDGQTVDTSTPLNNTTYPMHPSLPLWHYRIPGHLQI